MIQELRRFLPYILGHKWHLNPAGLDLEPLLILRKKNHIGLKALKNWEIRLELFMGDLQRCWKDGHYSIQIPPTYTRYSGVSFQVCGVCFVGLIHPIVFSSENTARENLYLAEIRKFKSPV
ncbi:proactivator polypeptide-like [Platysternon megacephalum]|uniref:Proactivator polypeptide-like n=1 Tax=Platysternon megacephalum TaxID=55544 RepID=A0A4D9ESH5_9SAUR|nr:proactivator polypeptide-like [Platysternon megacephalum]